MAANQYASATTASCSTTLSPVTRPATFLTTTFETRSLIGYLHNESTQGFSPWTYTRSGMGSNHPIIVAPHDATGQRVEIDGQTICIHEWRGSGPATLHVHRDDDEAWHVLEGELRFRFGDRTEVAPAGSTVFVPAGVARTHQALAAARDLLIPTP